jgi:hypothetical protein
VVPYYARDDIQPGILPIFFERRRQREGMTFTVWDKGQAWLTFLGPPNYRFYVIPKYKVVKPAPDMLTSIVAWRAKDTFLTIFEEFMATMKKSQEARVVIGGGILSITFEEALFPKLTEEDEGKALREFVEHVPPKRKIEFIVHRKK